MHYHILFYDISYQFAFLADPPIAELVFLYPRDFHLGQVLPFSPVFSTVAAIISIERMHVVWLRNVFTAFLLRVLYSSFFPGLLSFNFILLHVIYLPLRCVSRVLGASSTNCVTACSFLSPPLSLSHTHTHPFLLHSMIRDFSLHKLLLHTS